MIRRIHFTLLEILIVLGLIALIAGLVAININKILVNQRFRNEVSLVVDQLRLAQDMMLILDTDVHAIFSEDKKENFNLVKIQSETKLPEGIERELKRKDVVLKTIKGIFFEDKLGGETTQGRIDVKFLSRGAVMSKGIMRLATSDEQNPPANVLQNYICLPGYVRPIYSYETKEAADAACASLEKGHEEEELDRQLTRDTFSLLPEKMFHASHVEQTPKENVEEKPIAPAPGKKQRS
jgi:type II secretory pathway pseudopilin PulG